MSRSKPLAIDLFCGAGGASVGLARAGFDVIGVDIAPQPRYSFRFVQADALSFPLDGAQFVWASPVCKHWSVATRAHGPEVVNRWPREQIAQLRAKLQAWGGDYIIENVPGAPLHNPVMLCGTYFGLKVYRHRLFESSLLLFVPPHVPHRDNTPRSGRGISPNGFVTVAGKCFPTEYARAAMGIHWMTQRELSQAIPPAYSEYLGKQVLGLL